MLENYLDEIPEPTASGFEDPDVKEALRICNEWATYNQAEFWRRDFLNREMDNSLRDTGSPLPNSTQYPTSKTYGAQKNSVYKLTTQVLYAVRQAVVRQLANHSFKLKGGAVADTYRAFVTQAYISALEKAGYDNVMTNNDQFVGAGDQFWSYYWNPEYVENNKGFPVKIKSTGISKIFLPTYATAFRNYDDDREARKGVRCIFRGQWEAAKKLHPWIEEVGGTAGEIPIAVDQWFLNKQRRPECFGVNVTDENRLTEVFEFIDRDKKKSFMIAGRTAVKSPEVLEGDDFPYEGADEEAIFPMYVRKLIRPNYGMLGIGVLQATYRVAVIDRALQNIGVTYEMHNLNTIKIVALEDKVETVDGFSQKHRAALQAQLRGQEGVIFSRGVSGVGSLHAPPLINEMFAMIDLMEKNLGRLGFPIQLLNTDPNKTLGATEIEVENSTSEIRSIQRKNAGEIQAFLNDFLHWIAKNIDEDNNTPLHVSVPVRGIDGKIREIGGVRQADENGEERLVKITLGDLVKAQKKHQFYVEVNKASGIVNPQYIQKQKAREKYQIALQLGSLEAAGEAAAEMFAQDGIDFDLNFIRQNAQKLAQQAQAQAQGAQPAQQNSSSPLAAALQGLGNEAGAI